MPGDLVLEVRDLKTSFQLHKQDYRVLHGVSFEVARHETLCVVGESGCGKSVMTLSIMGLLPENATVQAQSIRLDGQELTALSPRQMNKVRGRKMGMIFQEPMTCLNPLLTIGRQMTEGLKLHLGLGKEEARRVALETLKQVGVSNPEERLRQYPFQLSGGLRQRVMIAMVLSLNPRLLIADEPTTALDVTIQKQVLLLLRQLKHQLDAGVLFITHDLGVVAEIADRVIVLYAGVKVEEGGVRQIFEQPAHPYTIGLLAAVPNIKSEGYTLSPIPGTPPNIAQAIEGCRFHPRCGRATDICREQAPALRALAPGHSAACHHLEVRP
ncbi:MAG: ABC transporter ATP-binding protein [Clostridiales bacterium]|nr:ABC transporter ATP-binding protein [Clostridiales bacterium]